MSLTYQPFAAIPEIEKLGEDLKMNLSDEERFGSAAIGAVLLGYGLARNAVTRWPALILGGLLLWRGESGKCHVKQALGQDGRHRRDEAPTVPKSTNDGGSAPVQLKTVDPALL